MTIETYLLYLAVLAAFFATPPDTSQLLIISQSLRHGLRRSFWTIAGDLSANAAQMTAAAFGLAAIVATSADLLALVKWAGVAYLAWIGLSLILKPAPSALRNAEAASAARLFRVGFLTSAANPYAVIFFAALFPQFIDPARAIGPQLVILGLTYLVVDGAILVAWGALARGAARRLPALSGPRLARVSGGLMVAAAALLATRDLSAEPR